MRQSIVLLTALLLTALSATTMAIGVSSQIIVSGEASLPVTLDQARFRMVVRSVGKTVEEARDANAASIAAIVESLRAFGILGDAIITSGRSVQPGGYTPSGQLLYELHTTLEVVVSIDQIDEVERGLNASGEAYIHKRILYEASDMNAYRTEAFRRAYEDAKARAVSYAESIGMVIVRPLTIEVQGELVIPSAEQLAVSGISRDMFQQLLVNSFPSPDAQPLFMRVRVVFEAR